MVPSEIEYIVRTSDVVSFDIFDTLVIRPFLRPNDVFLYIEENILEKHGLSIPFFTLRTKSELLARKVTGKNEVDIHDIYNEFQALSGLSDEKIKLLCEIENEIELELSRERPLGKEIYNLANKLGKEIVYVSDMYLLTDSVLCILQKSGYDIRKKLYLSSSENAVKHNGSLFKKIQKYFPDKKVVHIGDNMKSDYQQPQTIGWQSIHLPRSASTFFTVNANRELWLSTINRKTYHSPRHRLAISSYLAKSAHTIYDNPTNISKSHFEGNPYNLGYYGFGSLIFNFTLWLIREAINDGVEVLLFLSRDGLLLKEAYDIISPYIKNSPKSEYLLSSRRAYSLPAINDENDIIKSVNIGFQKTTIENILTNRYGLEINTIDFGRLKKLGVSHRDEICCIENRNLLIEILKLYCSEIIEAASLERQNLLEYFKKTSLNEERKVATVDIGYSGTLQKYLYELTGKKLGAFYMVSFLPCIDLINDGYVIKGYLANTADRHDRTHPWTKNLDMFESLFSSDTGSLICFRKNNNGDIYPVFSDVNLAESNRNGMLRDLQLGAVSFCRDMLISFGRDAMNYALSPSQSIKAYSHFLEHPSLKDIIVFQGVGFEDAYSGQKARFLISPLGVDLKGAKWTNGAIKLDSYLASSSSNVDISVNELIKPCEYLSTPPSTSLIRKFRKLKNSPGLFFLDSKIPLVSKITIKFMKLVNSSIH
jgi:predicted HAD superfamily hydrolase